MADSVGTPGPDQLYTAKFFQVFAALMFFMTGSALQFHFGQYVAFLGYGVDTLGHVLSISVVGTLLIRFPLGTWIDRFGCKPTWIGGALTVALAVGSMQFADRLWQLVVLRMLTTMSTAVVITTVAVFAAQIAPAHRRAESIGSMGLAGLVGMMVGPTVGDLIFAEAPTTILPYRIFFSLSAACALLSGFVIMSTRLPKLAIQADAGSADSGRTGAGIGSTLRVVIRHWPGMVLLIGAVFSMVFCLQMTFLERLAEQRGFMNIKLFFLAYCPTAVTLRIVLRHLPQRIGRTPTVLLGMGFVASGLFMLLGIDRQVQLILPGMLMGAGHCFVFPSMVDLAASRLPPEHRGMGTALILGAGDVGMLTGFATLGELIDRIGYDRSLTTLACAVILTATIFGITACAELLRQRARSST